MKLQNEMLAIEQLQLLIHDLCVDWGFCNDLSAQELVKKSNEISADQFAEAVLWAENMIPDYNQEWRRRIKRRFVDWFGHSKIEFS